MTDMGPDVREMLWSKSRELPPTLTVPPGLTPRIRRRVGMNALVAVVVIVLAGAGVVGGIRSLSSLAKKGNELGGQPGACTAASLDAIGSFEGAAGSREGTVTLANRSGVPCTLQGTPTIQLVESSGDPITTGLTFRQSPAEWQSIDAPQPAGWPVVNVGAAQAASFRVRWSNWCPDGRPAPTWRIELGGERVDIGGLDTAPPPPCNGRGLPSTIEVGPFEPASTG